MSLCARTALGASVAHPRRLGAFRLLSSSGLRAETNEEETVNFTRQATSEKGKVGAEQGAEDRAAPLAPLASSARARNGGCRHAVLHDDHLCLALRVIRRVSLASFSFVCSAALLSLLFFVCSAALLSLLFFVCFAAFLIIIISRFCSSRVEHGSTGMGTSWKRGACCARFFSSCVPPRFSRFCSSRVGHELEKSGTAWPLMF